MPTASIEKDLVLRAREAFTRHSRLLNRLMRERLSCGPVTVQQCYALEALAKAPLTMKALSSELALHQSTVTRIVEKLERQGYVARTRQPRDRRAVVVEITELGRETYEVLDENSMALIRAVLTMVPVAERESVVSALETLARALEPNCDAFQMLLASCCGPDAFAQGTKS